MHITVRRIIFYTLVAFFIVGGFYAVATALGITIGTSGTVTRTGSIFVAPIPRNAELSINGVHVEETPRFLSDGTLIKNLAPGTYDIRAEHEGRIAWRATLPVTQSLVTRATGIFLWPHPASSTLLTSQVESFTLSAGVPLVKTASGALMREERRIPGEEVAYVSNDSAVLITRTGNTVYLVRNNATNTTVNLTSLFHTLKEEMLGLPGIVPLVTVRPHPFSAGKFLITTETSLYILDISRFSLERLTTLSRIAAVTGNNSEVLLLGDDGALAAIDLIFKTVDTAPFTSSTVADLVSTADGEMLITLTEERVLSVYYRATGKHIAVADNVSEFTLEPSGRRLAYVRHDSLFVYFMNRYEGDTVVPAGARIPIPGRYHKPYRLTWSSSLSRYLFFLSEGNIMAAEVGSYGEHNNTTLLGNVRSFALAGFTAYLVREDGTLIALSFEE